MLIFSQEKDYEELENIFQGSDRCPTMNDLGEMQYLQRVIKETLRLYPSVPVIAREIKEDAEVGKINCLKQEYTLNNIQYSLGYIFS